MHYLTFQYQTVFELNCYNSVSIKKSYDNLIQKRFYIETLNNAQNYS